MEKQEIAGRRQVDRQTYRFMGFREQAAAIPRVWSSATFPTILRLFLPIPLPFYQQPLSQRNRRGGCKNFTANCLQTRPAASTLRPGKIGNPRETGGKTRLGQISSPRLYFVSLLRVPVRHLGQQSYQPTMILLASFVSKDFEARFKILLTPKVSRMSHPFDPI